MASIAVGAVVGAAGMYQGYEPLRREVLNWRFRHDAVAPSFVQKERAFSLEIVAQKTDQGLGFFLKDGDVGYEIVERDNDVVIGDVYHAWSHASHDEKARLLYAEWNSYSPQERADVVEQLGPEKIWDSLPMSVRSRIVRDSVQNIVRQKVGEVRSYLHEFGGEE